MDGRTESAKMEERSIGAIQGDIMLIGQIRLRAR